MSLGLAEGLMAVSTSDPKRVLMLYALLKASGVKATTTAITDYVNRARQILDDDGYSQEEITAMMNNRRSSAPSPEETKELTVSEQTK